uniref:RRM domain-containing protein n=1 Tax=Rhabditophanes sp. KR3021 TaxID=114890 RepID=A0AC35UIL6_9BILA
MNFRGNQDQGNNPGYNRGRNSIFVGNISYEVTEDTIKGIFSQVGPIIHMKMVHDRDTGKPRGYGFIEYADIQTAETAIRNLNQYDLNGRKLRVDSAAADRDEDQSNKPEANSNHQQQLQQTTLAPASSTNNSAPQTDASQIKGKQDESFLFGPRVEPGTETEHIARTVASMSPESMINVLKDMRDSAIKCPTETKNLLAYNPQLSYALLQMQVALGIVSLEDAKSLAHFDISAEPFHTRKAERNFENSHSRDTPLITSPPPIVRGPGPSRNVVSPINNAPPPHHKTFNNRPDMRIPPPNVISPPAPIPPGNDELDTNLLMSLLHLTPEQIELLPPEDKQRVLFIQSEFKNL